MPSQACVEASEQMVNIRVFGAVGLFAGSLALCSVPCEAQEAAPSRNLQDGVYTERQAARGEKTFARYCGGCHQSSQFTQNGLLGRHEGQTLEEVYHTLRSTMPKDSPGNLKPREYAVVLAYLFKLNGLPAGDEPLEMEDEVLRTIVVTGLRAPDQP